MAILPKSTFSEEELLAELVRINQYNLIALAESKANGQNFQPSRPHPVLQKAFHKLFPEHDQKP